MAVPSKRRQRLASLMARYEAPDRQAPSEPKPAFKLGQRVLIDKLNLTGKISRVRGYDPFGDNISYDIVLDSNHGHRLAGREVAWTEEHLSRTR